MSRSRKKTPITGNCGGSEKRDKRWANRSLRRQFKIALKQEKEILPLLRDVSNVYTFNKDGKHYMFSEEARIKWMRK